MSELISPCCNEELILVAAIDTKRLYKCSKCKNYTKPKEVEIEDRTADIDEDMPGEFVKIKEDE